MMNEIRIGRPLQPGVTFVPEGAYYSFDRGGHSLLLSFNAPTEAEVHAVSAAGEKRFALAVERNIIFLLAKFGSRPWVDAPYSIHLVPQHNRVLPEALDGSNSDPSLRVTLVDGRTGIVRATAAVALAQEFAERLHAAIRDQASHPWTGRLEYDSSLAQVYHQMSTRQMLKRARVNMRVRADSGDGSATVSGRGLTPCHEGECSSTRDRSAEIRAAVGDLNLLCPGESYHSPLPPELSEWYAYLSDQGHSILCIPAPLYNAGLEITELPDHLVAVPVKSAMRGYRVERGYVVANLPYDDCGVDYPAEDEEA